MNLSIDTFRLPDKIDPRTLRESLTLIQGELERAGYEGRWNARPIEQIRSRSQHRFRLSRVVANKLFVKVKPGDNGTAWEWELHPPAPLKAEIIFRDLSERGASNEVDSLETTAGVREAVGFVPTKPPVIRPDQSVAKWKEENGIDQRAAEKVFAIAPEKAKPAPEVHKTSVEAAVGLVGLGEKIKSLERLATEYRTRRQEIEQLTRSADRLLEEIARLEAEEKADEQGAQALQTLATLTSLMGGL